MVLNEFFLKQVDLLAEELHNNVPATVALQGDVDSVVSQVRYLVTSCLRLQVDFDIPRYSISCKVVSLGL